MKQSVLENFIKFTEPFEGYVEKMYVDQKNLVTTGYGNLIEVMRGVEGTGQITIEGLRLPWKRDSDNSLASQAEIIDNFARIKNAGVSGTGGGNQKHLTSLHLDQDAIVQLVRNKLLDFQSSLIQYIPAFETLPADAQLGILSMAWAMGPHFPRKYPNFTRAVNSLVPDFEAMARESVIPELEKFTRGAVDSATGLKEEGRNFAQVKLFRNAGEVFRQGLNPETLYYFGEIAKKGGIGVAGIGLFFGVGYLGYSYAKNKGWL